MFFNTIGSNHIIVPYTIDMKSEHATDENLFALDPFG